MNQRKSIAEHIRSLAQATGAPGSFVDQVRALFVTKGISLDEEVAPFLEALDEAFHREERIRLDAQRAQAHLTRIEQTVHKGVQESMPRPPGTGRAARQARQESPASSTRVAVRGSHRALVTRPVREELPLVPGPSDLQ
jgi:hypothetical protein